LFLVPGQDRNYSGHEEMRRPVNAGTTRRDITPHLTGRFARAPAACEPRRGANWYSPRESNPENLVSETSTYASSVRRALIGGPPGYRAPLADLARISSALAGSPGGSPFTSRGAISAHAWRMEGTNRTPSGGRPPTCSFQDCDCPRLFHHPVKMESRVGVAPRVRVRCRHRPALADFARQLVRHMATEMTSPLSAG
jgi:hypothetical protein